MRIYVASSWRNGYFRDVIHALRADGHQVYDFSDSDGFGWQDIDEGWRTWDQGEFIQGLQHPLAQKGFDRDMLALRQVDAVVYVMPCGVSASLEAGWAQGQGKRVYCYIPAPTQPDLMVKMFDVVSMDLDAIREDLKVHQLDVQRLDMSVVQREHLAGRILGEVQYKLLKLQKAGFNGLVESVMNDLTKMMAAGQAEYAGGENVFGNFVRGALEIGVGPEAVLWIYAMKHKDGIAAYLRGHKSQREPVEGRIIDLIVYLILLHCMVTVEKDWAL